MLKDQKIIELLQQQVNAEFYSVFIFRFKTVRSWRINGVC